MSKKYPECPLYNHDNCRDLHNPKLCAIVRKDKKCLKKNPIPDETETEMLNMYVFRRFWTNQALK